MKVIIIGSDRKLFEDNSAVLTRSLEYASRMESLHIIVFTLRKDNLEPRKIQNLYIYPTQSRTRFGYIWDAYRIGKRAVIENGFVRGASVVSGQDPFESGLVAYLLSRRFHLPMQLQVHTDMFSQYFAHTFLNNIRLRIASFLLPRAQAIRAVSEDIILSIRNRIPDISAHMDILPIFVDVEAIREAPLVHDLRNRFPQFTFVFFMASRLSPEKEIETALYALAEVIREFPVTGLVIAGDGPEKKHLEDISHNLGLADHVVFLGWQDSLASYYKTAGAYLLTSRYEGYGMSLIEAAAAGCPVVATPVGVVSRLIVDGENGFICPVGDSNCFAERMKTLIRDNAKRHLFKMAIRDSITDIAMPREEYVARYVSLLEGLLPIHP